MWWYAKASRPRRRPTLAFMTFLGTRRASMTSFNDTRSRSSSSAVPLHCTGVTRFGLPRWLNVSASCAHTSGVATDVAVLNTVLDAVQLFPPHSVYIIEDALRGFVPSLTEQAINAMKQSGAQFVRVAALKK